MLPYFLCPAVPVLYVPQYKPVPGLTAKALLPLQLVCVCITVLPDSISMHTMRYRGSRKMSMFGAVALDQLGLTEEDVQDEMENGKEVTA